MSASFSNLSGNTQETQYSQGASGYVDTYWLIAHATTTQ
jgi:hypothetical protein